MNFVKHAKIHGIAFAELVSYIEESRQEDAAPLFKLSNLANLYQSRMHQLGGPEVGKVHSTRLKFRLMNAIPDLEAHSQGGMCFLLSKRTLEMR